MNQFEISLVICSYNRQKFIGGALKSLLSQTLSNDRFEIVIVNNNSTDNTERIVKDFINENPQLNYTYVVEKTQGLSAARNRGIKESKSPLITFMDDDGEATQEFLEVIVDYMDTNPQVSGIGGKVLPIYESEEPKWLNPWLGGMLTIIDFGEKEFIFKGKKYPAGCNMTYRKELLEQVGGFNEKLQWRVDDKYIYYEIQKVNRNIMYLPKAVVYHNIDAYRVTDSNFIKLSSALGRDEAIRVKSKSFLHFFSKVIEYIFKLGASFVILFTYLLRGNWSKGSYTVLFRWYALTGLFSK